VFISVSLKDFENRFHTCNFNQKIIKKIMDKVEKDFHDFSKSAHCVLTYYHQCLLKIFVFLKKYELHGPLTTKKNRPQ